MKLDEAKSWLMGAPESSSNTPSPGLYDQINVHLVKLVGFDFSPGVASISAANLRAWLNKIQSLRFKPNRRPGSFKFYFDPLIRLSFRRS